ncbi:MAG: hypothetical protein ACE5GJ_01000 [Gemmatimonadota bacterium]
MKRTRILGVLSLMGALSLAACDVSEPAAPALDELTPEDQIALDVLTDDDAIQAALDLVRVPATAHNGMGWTGAPATEIYAGRAREHFTRARQMLDDGALSQAVEEALQARLAVAEGMAAMGGREAIQSMIARMDFMAETLGSDFGTPGAQPWMAQEMAMLAETARAALGSGNTQGAGQWGVLAEQRARQHLGAGYGDGAGYSMGWTGDGRNGGWQHGMGMGGGWNRGMGGMWNGGMGGRHGPGARGDSPTEHAELAVNLASAAVTLATDLLSDVTPDSTQTAYLEQAADYAGAAAAALAEGSLAEAAYNASHARWAALLAVLPPGTITEENAAWLLGVAQDLLARARAAVGDTPTELEADLLAQADALIDMAEDHLSWGNLRSVSPSWHAAVIAALLLG